jgi:hypothetical protein
MGQSAPLQPAGQRPPDGRSLLERMLGIAVARAHGLPTEIWVIGADGQGLRQITSARLDDAQLAWSPDSRRVAYTNGLGGIAIVGLDGAETRPVATLGDYGGIAWAPR